MVTLPISTNYGGLDTMPFSPSASYMSIGQFTYNDGGMASVPIGQQEVCPVGWQF